MAEVRVTVVDHQPVYRRGLELLLPALTDGRVRVVATSEDAASASLMALRHRPDLAVVDLSLPPPGGLRAIAALRRTTPEVRVVAMADEPESADGEWVVRALRAGARGVLLKSGEPEALVPPLLAVVDGSVVVPPSGLERLLSTSSSGRDGREGLAGLTTGERDLWRLVATGHTSRQIANRLHMSERTAKRLTAALLRRLGAATRMEAALLAGQAGVGTGPNGVEARVPEQVRRSGSIGAGA